MISFITTGLWLLTIRFGFWDLGYRSGFSGSGALIFIMAIAYLILSSSFLLGILRGMQVSSVISIMFFSIIMSWSIMEIGYPWPSYVLLILQVFTVVLGISSCRETSNSRKKGGLSPLDLPVFG